MKEIKVTIESEDLEALKQNKYILCIAKQVDDQFTVIWQAKKDYLVKNKFRWEPGYQVFGAECFKVRSKLEVSTKIVPIAPGQKINIDRWGILGDPEDGGKKDKITIINDFGSIYPGLADIDGTPIYVQPTKAFKGITELAPADIFRVWFDQKVETGTIIQFPASGNSLSSTFSGLSISRTESQTKYCTVTLTDKSSVCLEYEDQEWKYV